MKHRILPSALLFATLAAAGLAADPSTSAPAAAPAPAPAPAPDSKKALEEAIKARLNEHALKHATKTAAVPKADPNAKPVATPQDAAAQAAKAKEEEALLLPQVQVSQSRITELDRQLHEVDLEIAREKKKLKPTEVDNSLNDSQVSSALSIFGGSSADDRAHAAQERISLLEAEKDLLNEIALARTKEEKDALQKELIDLKTLRRELDRPIKDAR